MARRRGQRWVWLCGAVTACVALVLLHAAGGSNLGSLTAVVHGTDVEAQAEWRGSEEGTATTGNLNGGTLRAARAGGSGDPVPRSVDGALPREEPCDGPESRTAPCLDASGSGRASNRADKASASTSARVAPAALPELRVFFVTIVGTDQPVDLLDAQLRHYHALGVPFTRMGVVLHVNPPPSPPSPPTAPAHDQEDETMPMPPSAPYLEAARAIVSRYPGVLTRVWHERFRDGNKVRELLYILRDLGFSPGHLLHTPVIGPNDPHDWVVYADSDELHQYVDLAPDALATTSMPLVAAPHGPGADGPLPRLLTFLAAHNVHAIEGRFLDRVADGGALVALDTTRSPFEQYPYGCGITCCVVRGTPTKLMAWRLAQLRHGDGGFHEHDTGSAVNHLKRILPPTRGGWVHHFKWVAGIVEESRARLADFTARHFSYVTEVRLLVEYFDRHHDRIGLQPDQPPHCFRCSGKGGLVGPGDGMRYLTPLSDATIEEATFVITAKGRPQ
jgi:hypothetical protein